MLGTHHDSIKHGDATPMSDAGTRNIDRGYVPTCFHVPLLLEPVPAATLQQIFTVFKGRPLSTLSAK